MDGGRRITIVVVIIAGNPNRHWELAREVRGGLALLQCVVRCAWGQIGCGSIAWKWPLLPRCIRGRWRQSWQWRFGRGRIWRCLIWQIEKRRRRSFGWRRRQRWTDVYNPWPPKLDICIPRLCRRLYSSPITTVKNKEEHAESTHNKIDQGWG